MEHEHLINALFFAVEQCAKSGFDIKSTSEKLNISINELNELMDELPQVKEAFAKGRKSSPHSLLKMLCSNALWDLSRKKFTPRIW